MSRPPGPPPPPPPPAGGFTTPPGDTTTAREAIAAWLCRSRGMGEATAAHQADLMLSEFGPLSDPAVCEQLPGVAAIIAERDQAREKLAEAYANLASIRSSARHILKLTAGTP